MKLNEVYIRANELTRCSKKTISKVKKGEPETMHVSIYIEEQKLKIQRYLKEAKKNKSDGEFESFKQELEKAIILEQINNQSSKEVSHTIYPITIAIVGIMISLVITALPDTMKIMAMFTYILFCIVIGCYMFPKISNEHKYKTYTDNMYNEVLLVIQKF